MLQLAKGFPRLGLPPNRTSDPTPLYNCIAWAFGSNVKRWWPNLRGYYWPVDAKGLTDLAAFEKYLSDEGWVETTNRGVEFGIQKLALYTLDGRPKHMARQLGNGTWTSKLGDNIDIGHDLEELEGPQYGTVLKVVGKSI